MEGERVDQDALQEYDGASLSEWGAERWRTSGERHVGRGDSRLYKRGLGQRSRNHVCISSKSNRKPQKSFIWGHPT